MYIGRAEMLRLTFAFCAELYGWEMVMRIWNSPLAHRGRSDNLPSAGRSGFLLDPGDGAHVH